MHKLIPVAILMVIFGFLVNMIIVDNQTTETITIKALDKHIYGETGESFQVLTKNEVLALQSDFVSGFYEPAEIYATIKKGFCYKVFLRGKRRKIPIMPTYRNIEKAEEVPCPIAKN